jgi:glycerophosphoryl diester phosphodiesterase
VFVEMNRRTSVPSRIIELLEDLKTLTDIKLNDWTIIVDDTEYEPTEEVLKQVIVLSPHNYRVDEEREEDLNEMRHRAGLDVKPIHTGKQDAELRAFKSIAGL